MQRLFAILISNNIKSHVVSFAGKGHIAYLTTTKKEPMRLFVITLLVTISLHATSQTAPAIIPAPVRLQLRPGSFAIDRGTALATPAGAKALPAARFLRNYIREVSGIELPIAQSGGKGKAIEFILGDSASLGEEGYHLRATPNRIRVSAYGPKGLFYGVETLIQTLPAIRNNDSLKIPCMDITDYPRFQWRGMMLDVSRHFFSPDMVKEFIDVLAAYKMNVFHWHLTDGAGWRLEIKKYPLLTAQAAWRVEDRDRPWNWSGVTLNADRTRATYGGYYTQEQAREIVAYARERNVTVVPEIEMPGHSEIVMAAYPFLCCHPRGGFSEPGDFLASSVSSNYCPGNDSTFRFIEDVLTEVMRIFPSEYIHVGGDEVDKTDWKTCPKCQRRIREEGLKDEEGLQSYFMRRIETFLTAHHRKLIGWDEILEGGLAPSATVMSWRGEDGGIAAARMGHDVVMTPGTPCYFDHYQGDPAVEPPAIGGFNTLKMVYNYEPIPAALDSQQAKHVLGSQANLWTEYIPSRGQAEYMMFPRLLALSEVLWTPASKRDWQDFNARLQPHLRGFADRGIRYAPGNFRVTFQPAPQDNQLLVKLIADDPDAMIHYTVDGSTPGLSSPVYNSPIPIDSDMRIKAIVVLRGQVMGRLPSEQSFSVDKATGHAVNYVYPPSTHFPAGGPNALTDGIRGGPSIDQQWHGFEKDDLIATIDLGAGQDVSRLTLGCIQQWGSWVFLPLWVRFEVSEDGTTFSQVGQVDNTIPPDTQGTVIKDFTLTIPTRKARFIRVTAANPKVCPKGHPGEGKPCWIFADELMVR